MTLREKQSLFTLLVAELVQHAATLGYAMTYGEAWRSDAEQARLLLAGHSHVERSLHQDRLAVDLNLFREGKWLTKTEDHLPLGEWWEARHPLCRWGGRFSDGNHYSLEHEGRK